MQLTVKKQKEEENIQKSTNSKSEENKEEVSDQQEVKETNEDEEKKDKKADHYRKDRRKPIKVDIDVKDKPLDELKELIRGREVLRTQCLDKLRDLNKQRDQVKEKRDEFNQGSAESFAKGLKILEKAY
jgi:hypothetical protein